MQPKINVHVPFYHGMALGRRRDDTRREHPISTRGYDISANLPPLDLTRAFIIRVCCVQFSRKHVP